MRLSNRLVQSSAVNGRFCTVAVRALTQIIVKVGIKMCGCGQTVDFCIDQNTYAPLRFSAPDTDDFSAATEITFTVFDKRPVADNTVTALLTKTLTGGGITLVDDHTLDAPLSATDTDLAAARRWYEVGMLDASSRPTLIGRGFLTVNDNGTYD